MSALMELCSVSKEYVLPQGQRVHVLKNVELRIDPGEVLAILGRSGSGKSTLLHLLGLLDTPTSGIVRCEGQDIARLGDAGRSRLRGSFIGFVFQQYFLIDRRTALENVAEPLLWSSRREVRERTERAKELLDQVGLTDRLNSMPHLLSGGEQQRVALARALVRRPRVVLADEPTGSLDETTGERILDMLITLVRSHGVALVLVTHDHAVAARADRTLTLRDGVLHRQ